MMVACKAYIHILHLYIITLRSKEFSTILKLVHIDMDKGYQGEEEMPL